MRITKRDFIIAIFLVMLLIFTFIARPSICIIEGDSMEPTFYDEQVLLTVRPSQIRRNEIVIIKREDGPTIIKRVIGIPYDTVHIHDGRVYVNEEMADERQTDFAGLAFTPLTLGEGEYFVLGDNREKSLDSRYKEISIVDEEQILRKVVLVD